MITAKNGHVTTTYFGIKLERISLGNFQIFILLKKVYFESKTAFAFYFAIQYSDKITFFWLYPNILNNEFWEYV